MNLTQIQISNFFNCLIGVVVLIFFEENSNALLESLPVKRVSTSYDKSPQTLSQKI